MLKDINYNKWRIVSLGFSGNLNGSIYEASLKKLDENVQYHLGVEYVGGVDWGDGKSATASASVAYFGALSLDTGIDIYAEYEYWNNRGEVLDTHQQMVRICEFYIKAYQTVRKPIIIHVDNAALGDFYRLFNQTLKCREIVTKYGDFSSEIEFLPANKLKNTWERVEVVNSLMSLGILRYNRDKCPGLYKAMENCYEVVKTNPTESAKRERSHEWTHWLHALEYMIDLNLKEFEAQLPEVLTTSKSLSDNYGVY